MSELGTHLSRLNGDPAGKTEREDLKEKAQMYESLCKKVLAIDLKE